MLFEVVEHLDPTGKAMVARIPETGSGDFTTGSQLIVQDNQVAVFYRDGKMCDQFRAGRYTLSTQNLPIIKTLTKFAFRGKSPFRAYVYFVSLKTFIDMGWGTPNRILYRDENFTMGVNLGAFGTYSLRITDHVKFLNTIVGTQGFQDTEAVEEYLRKLIASRFAGTLAELHANVYDLPGQYDLIGATLKTAVAPEFAQYGLTLVDLVVVNISLPETVTKEIDRRSRVDMYDQADVSIAQGLAIADALPEAAANPGGGLGMGMGLGAGVGIGGALAHNAVTRSQGAIPGGSAAPPPPPTVQWFAYVNDSQVGPMNPQQLAAAIQGGRIATDTMVWRQGMAAWTPAGQVADLAQAFQASPPPPPPPPPSTAPPAPPAPPTQEPDTES